MRIARGVLAIAFLAVAWILLPVLMTLLLAVGGAVWYVRSGFDIKRRA